MKKFVLFFLCLLCGVAIQAQEGGNIVIDVLNQSVTGISVSSYSDFSGKKVSSNATYAGRVAGSYGSIQMRTTDEEEGVVTTNTGGKVRTIEVKWNTNTKAGRILNVYGKNGPYSSAKDLFDSTPGTLLGTFKYDGTNTDGTLTIEGDYGYVGFRSSDGALYVNEISIHWEVDGSVTPTVASPVITESCNFTESMVVSLSCGTEDATIYYTVDGTEPTRESEVYADTPFTITQTTTVKAMAVKEGMNDSEVVEATYTMVEASSWSLVTDAANLAVNDRVVLVSSVSDYAMSTNQKTNNRGAVEITKIADGLIVNDEVQILTLEEGAKTGTFAFNTGSGYLYAASSSDNYLKTEATKDAEGSWKITITDGVASIVAQGNNTRNVMQYNQPYTLFSCYASASQKPICIYKEIPEGTAEEAFEVKINKYGYATLFLDKAVAVPEGLTAYYCTVDGTTAVLNEVGEVIPAATGVVLRGTANTTYTLANTTAENSDAAVIADDNMLMGYVVDTDVPMGTDAYYALNAKDGTVGFFVPQTVSEDGLTFTAKANKAYLKLGGTANVQMLSIRQGMDGDETAVENSLALPKTEEMVYYDLTGRRVYNPGRGIYIVNGKKLILR